MHQEGAGNGNGDGSLVIFVSEGRYIICLMKRNADLFLERHPVANWQEMEKQAKEAVQKHGGLQRGQLHYLCPPDFPGLQLVEE